MQYSKFASIKAAEEPLSNPIGSQLGMMIIYTPAMLVAASFAFGGEGMFHTSLAANLVFLHFLKRTSEVVGLHKYSGKVEIQVPVAISIVYMLYAAVVSSLAVPIGMDDPIWTAVGYALFAVGMLGNFYHHYLLTTLRKEGVSNEKQYTPPVGGMFGMVASPHYLFELIIWLGISCVAQQTNAFLVLLSMASYLAARAQNTNDYYSSTFTPEEWPRARKAIIPFII